MLPDSDVDKKTMISYTFVILAMCVLLMVGFVYNTNVATYVLFLIAIVFAIFLSTRRVHIPPVMLLLLLVIAALTLFSRIYGDYPLLDIFQDVLTGIVLGLISLIVAYAFLKEIPGPEKERTAHVAAMAFMIGVSTFTLWETAAYFVLGPQDDFTDFMETFVWVLMGLIITSGAFFAGYSTRLFDVTVMRFLKQNSEAIGVRSMSETEIIKKIIAEGESETLEFKATLRTNLATGEKDKRMERAVLKTIVAFMNTNGGTLLVGVTDDGVIAGVDEDSFENRDKMSLHLTHMFSNQIGNHCLPFISFKLVSFENVCVIKIVVTAADKPVFLKDVNSDAYFVRSGPSSVELTGMSLLNYVENRKKN